MVTLIGFRLASQEADEEHPFGHGRMEYLAGLVVSMLILLVGVELAQSSFQKILHPEPVDFSTLSAVILAVSIGVKVQGDADAPGEHSAPAAHLRALGVIAPQAKTQKKVHE